MALLEWAIVTPDLLLPPSKNISCSVAVATYILYYTDALSVSAVWNTLSTLTGAGGVVEWLDDATETGAPSAASGTLKRFCRLTGQPDYHVDLRSVS